MTRWIVFDAMGVIFDEGDDILNRLVPFLRRRGLTMDGEVLHEVYRRASLGLVAPRDFWEAVGFGAEYPAIEREYLEACLQLDPQFVPAAESLAARYSLAILSNDIAEWSAYLRKRHGLDDLFRAAVISGEVGVRKPAPEIYRILLERLHARGGDCVFVDDRIANLAPAAELGIVPVLRTKEGKPAAREIRYRIKSLSELPALVEGIFAEDPPA